LGLIYMATLSRVLFSKQSDNWATPKVVLESLEKEFGPLFDPCPLHGEGGLEKEWMKKNFVNPPYSDIKSWVKKANDEAKKGKLVVMLIPARTDTKWFHEYIYQKGPEVRFLKGRLKFGDSKNSAPFPSMLVIWGS